MVTVSVNSYSNQQLCQCIYGIYANKSIVPSYTYKM